MKQNQIIDAYKALKSMGEMDIPLKTAYQIFMLKKKLEPTFLFRIEKERELVNKYGGVVNMDGTIQFKDAESAAKFRESAKELDDIDSEVCFEPVSIPMDQFGDIKIKPNDIGCLDGFVKFE